VVEIDAYIFHYGFVRPPFIMQKKRKDHNTHYQGEASTEKVFKDEDDSFDYGDLSKLKIYRETHPIVMKEFIGRFNWQEHLHYRAWSGRKKLLKHEKLKYRLLTLFEQTFFKGNLLFGYKNYHILKVK